MLGSTIPLVRCAHLHAHVLEEGLEQGVQLAWTREREGPAAAYIKSQAHEGWQCVPDAYDDGGFSGGNTDRPALQRLRADIAAGKIDTVVTYKVECAR